MNDLAEQIERHLRTLSPHIAAREQSKLLNLALGRIRDLERQLSTAEEKNKNYAGASITASPCQQGLHDWEPIDRDGKLVKKCRNCPTEQWDVLLPPAVTLPSSGAAIPQNPFLSGVCSQTQAEDVMFEIFSIK